MIKQKYLRKLSNFSENDLKENQNSNQRFFDDMNSDYRKMDTLMDLMRFSEKLIMRRSVRIRRLRRRRNNIRIERRVEKSRICVCIKRKEAIIKNQDKVCFWSSNFQ